MGGILDGIPSGVAGAIVGIGGTLVLNQLGNLIRIDHPLAMNFAVQIDGFFDAGFLTCEGLHDRSRPYEIKQCNFQTKIPIYPYEREIGSITLTKGVTFQGKMEEWYYDMINFQKGDPSPIRDVSIIQLMRVPRNVPILGGQLIELIRYEVPDCVCEDLTFTKFRSKSDEVSILQSVIRCTKPHKMPKPTAFGNVGILLDALMP
ncbi:MAG: hypothetical protein HKP62_04550 [Sulfurovum sp.]|nr:phage tail protein [Sulfurovum sp.]NNJ45268.1 hypothetical protein [Sulfurovum sp.]